VSYAIFKFLHILGAVLLVGNVTVTSVWKVFADRTRDPLTVAYAQRLVTLTDWAFTGSGIVLTMLGGYGMAIVSRMDLLASPWLLWGQVLFAASGCIWLFVLVRIQIAQSRLSARFTRDAPIPEAYWQLGRRWLVWGIVATVPLIAALYVMVAKG
jgi:uncharacterized membrane protein